MDQTDKMIERQRMEQEIEKNAKIHFQKQKVSKIDSFTEYYEFLHNNFYTPVYYECMLFPSVTHAYQAARSNDERTRRAILNAENLKTVLNIARRIEDSENWNIRRLKIMEQLIRDKFRRSKELQEKLKATGSREIVMTYEEETVANTFWGAIKSKGQNQLGRILMKIREDIKENNELLNWITMSFDLISDNNLIPELVLNVYKNNSNIDCVTLSNKSFYLIGCLPSSDVQLTHPSISRYHGVIICDKNLGMIIVDLRSKAGTKLDSNLLQDHIPYKLKDGNKLSFAQSTREYVVSLDMKKMQKIYENEKKQLESEIELLKKLENPNKLEMETLTKTFGIEDNDNNKNIFVSNIPYDAKDEILINIFKEFGEIRHFRCPVEKESGRKRGHCFVEYKNKDNAKLAVKKGLVSCSYFGDNNKFLRVKYAEPIPDWRKADSLVIENKDTRKEYEGKMKTEVMNKIENKKYTNSKSRKKSRSYSNSKVQPRDRLRDNSRSNSRVNSKDISSDSNSNSNLSKGKKKHRHIRKSSRSRSRKKNRYDRDSRGYRDHRDYRDPRDSRSHRDNKNSKDYKDFTTK